MIVTALERHLAVPPCFIREPGEVQRVAGIDGTVVQSLSKRCRPRLISVVTSSTLPSVAGTIGKGRGGDEISLCS
jgi:hypothetical protein